jgi:exosortase
MASFAARRLQTRHYAGIAAVTFALALVYWHVALDLGRAWTTDDNYSHGFLIVPIAAWFAWERRGRLAAEPVRSSWLGVPVLVISLLMLLGGLAGAELFTTRLSLIGTLGGIVLFLFGWGWLRVLAFPLAFLLLMIPLPAIIFNQIAFPLQLLASRAGELAISTAGIPVLREGNVLILANTSLEVAEACSGIRSLVSLIALGIVYGYFMDRRAWVRMVVVLSAVPVAVFANAARVAGTGIAAHWWGPAAAQGFFHEFSGWVVFVAAFLMILAIQRLIIRVSPMPAAQAVA